MKTDLLPRQLLLALALIGLMIGCGGNKDTEEKPGETGKGAEEKSAEGGDAKGNGNQSAAKKPEAKKADLAASLSGKRIVFSVSGEGAPPPSTQLLFQFETDGTFNGGMVQNGKAMGKTDGSLAYKVNDLKVSILKNGADDGTIIFSTPSLKKGDEFIFEPKGRTFSGTISKIEKAGPLAKTDFGPATKVPTTVEGPEVAPSPPEEDPTQPKDDEEEDPGGPDGPGGLGGPAFGIGPNGEFAKSKHPAFIAHTWKTGPFSKGVKQTATFDKTGALTITLDKGKPIKGTWEVAGPQITLTYPDPATGKEQALKYRFLFGGGESEGANGKTIEIESLILKGVGNNKTSVLYERPLGP